MTPGAHRRIQRLMSEAETDEEWSRLLDQLLEEGALQAVLELEPPHSTLIDWYITAVGIVGEA